MKIGFYGLLAIAFIVLKLTGQIAWSWVWVLAPMWMGGVGFLIIALFCLVMAAVTVATQGLGSQNNQQRTPTT